MTPSTVRAALNAREQLADLHAPPVPCASVALDYDSTTGRFDYPTRCVLAEGHAEHHTDGCLVWSDWTAERERDVDATWVRAMEKPRPVTAPTTFRGLRTG